QDGGHRSEKCKVRQLGEERLAEVVEKPDHQASDQGALEASHASNDDHNERVRKNLEVGARINAYESSSDPPPPPGQERAEREHDHRDSMNVDTNAARHLRVIHS